MTKLILRNFQSPGDLVMLTAAVRDLHACCPGKYRTDVRTSCAELWFHNPHISHIDDGDPEALEIQCHYPLVHQSNQRPYHFIHGFAAYLSERLAERIEPKAFKGDIHLSDEERAWPAELVPELKSDEPFWIVVAGGKLDFTIKWWDPTRFQAVVDHFLGRLRFVQVGASDHHHPPLRNTIDLRGRTSTRELIGLMHHARGVLCPVTFAMHLAAAVPTRAGMPLRACVVVAGGREPAHWEAYPSHQFIHTIGALPCCATGGCWKSRTVPLGNNDPKDRRPGLCLDVVGNLPKCMDMISAAHVAARIEMYL